MKIYEYKDCIYCDKDLSETEDRYAGDLFDLFCELEKEYKTTSYTIYTVEGGERTYDGPEELIEEEFDDLCIGETEEETCCTN